MTFVLTLSPQLNMESVFQYRHCVTADEIDSQQHVHNLRYLQWTLWAAHAHSAAGGWDSAAALKQGVGWVVRSHDIVYRAAAFAGDELTILTWISEMNDVAITRRYWITRPSDQQVLAKVATKWVFVDLVQHRALMIPAAAKQSVVVHAHTPRLPWQL